MIDADAFGVADRMLPHNLEAECSVLGAILVESKHYHVAAAVVRSRDFYREAHKLIFEALATLVERGVPPDHVLLKDELARLGQLDECGGPFYISQLGDVPRATNVEYYARVVREKAALRDLIDAANKVLTDAYEATDASALVVERGLKALSSAVPAHGGGLVGADAAILSWVQALDSGDLGAPVATGYRDLDELTGGFKPGDLVYVAARPSVGKTAFALCAADHMATHGHSTAFFSCEMSLHGISGRLLSRRARVPMTLLERKQATDAMWQRVSDAMSRDQVPLYIEEHARTVTEIGAWCRKLRDREPLACAVVDYVQLLVADRRRDSDEAEIAGISAALKRLAKDLKIVVVALSQLSRAPEGRKDKRPQMSDLRGSGALEQDADMAILLYREEMYDKSDDKSGIAEVILAKNRNGPVGVVRMAFVSDIGLFADLAHGI